MPPRRVDLVLALASPAPPPRSPHSIQVQAWQLVLLPAHCGQPSSGALASPSPSRLLPPGLIAHFPVRVPPSLTIAYRDLPLAHSPQRSHLATLLHARALPSPLSSSRASFPSPFAPAFASTRRTFASTAPASAWFPSFGASNKDTAAPPVEAAAPPATSFVDEPSTAAAVASEPAQAGAVPLPPTPAPVDAVAPGSAAPVDEAATGAVQNVYDGIATGSLDLSSLVGSFGPHPIMRLQSLFLHLHESFPLLGHPGVQWALVIPAVTLFLRLLLFPFQVRAQSNAARMAIIQPEMLKGMNKLKDAKARNDFHAMQAAQMETQALMKKHDVNPIRNLVFPLAQAAVFMCMFFALRGLANAGLVSMSTEGFGWVQDLTQPDPYYLLPVTSTALTLATLEVRPSPSRSRLSSSSSAR